MSDPSARLYEPEELLGAKRIVIEPHGRIRIAGAEIDEGFSLFHIRILSAKSGGILKKSARMTIFSFGPIEERKMVGVFRREAAEGAWRDAGDRTHLAREMRLIGKTRGEGDLRPRA